MGMYLVYLLRSALQGFDLRVSGGFVQRLCRSRSGHDCGGGGELMSGTPSWRMLSLPCAARPSLQESQARCALEWSLHALELPEGPARSVAQSTTRDRWRHACNTILCTARIGQRCRLRKPVSGASVRCTTLARRRSWHSSRRAVDTTLTLHCHQKWDCPNPDRHYHVKRGLRVAWYEFGIR